MLGRKVATRTIASGDPTFAFRRLPEGWISSFDYSVGNLEGPVTNIRLPPTEEVDRNLVTFDPELLIRLHAIGIDLKMGFDPSVLPVLRDQGFRAFSHANNHTLDQGKAGFEESVRRLREQGFVVFGHPKRADAIAYRAVSINGTSFGLCGFNLIGNELDRSSAAETLARVRAEVDILIVLPHWGPDFQDHPGPREREFAHWLVSNGADLIIGGHPHVEQGFSLIGGVPVAWSLGNFIFDQEWSENTCQGFALAVTVDRQGWMLEPIPYTIETCQPRLLVNMEREHRLRRLGQISDDDLAQSVTTGSVKGNWRVRPPT